MSEEPDSDRELRLFFSSETPFGISRQVMKTSISSYTYGQQMMSKPASEPLLTRCYSCGDENVVTCSDHTEMYAPLYAPYRYTTHDTGELEQDQKRRGQSFKLHIAYQGDKFCGWQIQPNNDVPSVQQTLIDRLDPILNVEFTKPIDIRVCGRTDAGVSALGQVCRVRTLRSKDDVGISQIMRAINYGNVSDNDDGEHNPVLWCTTVERVTDKFHPTFDATSRAYAYLIDAKLFQGHMNRFCEKEIDMENIVSVMNAMLHKIEGVELDFFALSFGKVKTSTNLCTLSRFHLSLVETANGNQALCFELVGDRFLRRMVRILIATIIRETMEVFSVVESPHDHVEDFDERLLKIIQEGKRDKSAKAAPPDGLIFVGASFSTSI